MALASLVVVVVTDGARAQSGGGFAVYNGTASSQLIFVTAGPQPGLLLDPLLDPGVTMAQAGVDSLGTSTAYAKSVFPGTLYSLLPGLGTLVGAAVPVPANPLEVASADPTTPSAEQTLGTIQLRATSDPTTSAGSATNGGDEAKASVVANAETGEITSTADAALTAVKVSGLLELDGLRASARAHRSSGGELEKSSSLELTAISVAGQRVALTPGTLELLGTPEQLPLVSPIRSVLSTLTGAGFNIEYVPAVDLADGVQSAALRITYAVKPPPTGFNGVESFNVVVTLGGAIATAGNGSIGPVAAPPANAFSGAASPASSGSVGSIGSTGTTGRVGSSPAASTGTGLSSNPAAPAATPASYVIPGIRSSLAAFYPILVLAAALMYGLTRFSSFLGGQRR